MGRAAAPGRVVHDFAAIVDAQGNLSWEDRAVVLAALVEALGAHTQCISAELAAIFDGMQDGAAAARVVRAFAAGAAEELARRG